MTDKLTPNGIVQEEPLLWEKGRKGKTGFSMPRTEIGPTDLDSNLMRKDLDLPDLSEVDVIRHYTRLSQWNFALDAGSYPLGSCTMKYNPKINDKLAGLAGFTESHPLLRSNQTQGILRIMYELEQLLCEITGMEAVSLQPAAGAHGELAGMLIGEDPPSIFSQIPHNGRPYYSGRSPWFQTPASMFHKTLDRMGL